MTIDKAVDEPRVHPILEENILNFEAKMMNDPLYVSRLKSNGIAHLFHIFLKSCCFPE